MACVLQADGSPGLTPSLTSSWTRTVSEAYARALNVLSYINYMSGCTKICSKHISVIVCSINIYPRIIAHDLHYFIAFLVTSIKTKTYLKKV